jgi:uncharacterized SAM-binding protein YcdF (DUF218 family)
MTYAPAKPDPRRRGRIPLSRRAQRILIAFVLVFVIFCATTAYLFVWPQTGMPARVDAIVVPGGPGNRIQAAKRLADQDRAPYLVLSQGEPVPHNLCGTHVGFALVICFMPNPDTTQGEAEATARLAKRYDWQSIVLLTTPDQTWRAELRFRRCYGGRIYGVTTALPTTMWPLMIVYQWAATAKAELVNRGC